MKYKKKKPFKIQALIGFKPMTKYFPALIINEISKKTACKILMERACGISKEKAYNILTFVGFKPITSKAKYFPVYEISKEKR